MVQIKVATTASGAPRYVCPECGRSRSNQQAAARCCDKIARAVAAKEQALFELARKGDEIRLGGAPQQSLPEDDAQRGLYPMADGCLDYFPNALAEVARISYEGNLKHNPGQPMHWSRGKSTDHRNKIIRHTVDSNIDGEKGIEHAAQAAWRALAHLQEKIERARGVPVSRGSKVDESR